MSSPHRNDAGVRLTGTSWSLKPALVAVRSLFESRHNLLPPHRATLFCRGAGCEKISKILVVEVRGVVASLARRYGQVLLGLGREQTTRRYVLLRVSRLLGTKDAHLGFPHDASELSLHSKLPLSRERAYRPGDKLRRSLIDGCRVAPQRSSARVCAISFIAMFGGQSVSSAR